MTVEAEQRVVPIGGLDSPTQLVVRWSMPLVLIALILLGSITTPGFLSLDNFRSILINGAVVGIVAVGMTPVTMSGNLFSLGISESTMLAAVAFLALAANGVPIAIAGLLTLILLVLLGIGQAYVVAAGLNPIITTLAVGAIIFGTVTFLTNGNRITAPGANIAWIASSDLFGIPFPIYVFFAYAALTWFVTEKTIAGRQAVLVGTNADSAKNSGISLRATAIFAFISMSVGIAIAGILSAGRYGAVTSGDYRQLTIDVIAAVLVGGTAIQGGAGSPIRSAVGALIIVIFGNVMLLQGFDTGVRTLGVGLLVIIVVSVLHVLRRVARK